MAFERGDLIVSDETPASTHDAVPWILPARTETGDGDVVELDALAAGRREVLLVRRDRETIDLPSEPCRRGYWRTDSGWLIVRLQTPDQASHKRMVES